MSKVLSLIGILVVIAFGVYWYTTQMSQSVATEDNTSPIDEAENVVDQIESKGLVSSINDAITLGTPMRCVYKTEKDGSALETEVFVEGEKFRSRSTVGDVTTEILSDGENQYMWTNKDTKGFKMNKTCMEDLMKMAPASNEPTNETNTQPSPQSIDSMFDFTKNVSCNPAENINFQPPSEISFTDQCALIQGGLDKIEDIKNKIPVEIPAGIRPY